MEHDTKVVLLEKLFEQRKIENIPNLPMADEWLKHIVQGIKVECDDSLFLVRKVMNEAVTDFSICSSDQNNFLVHKSSPLLRFINWKVDVLPANVVGGGG